MVSDTSGTASSPSIVSKVRRVRDIVVRWGPGFQRDAPKRNLLLAVIYMEVLILGVAVAWNLL
jgi:hypothetical protein